jgi:hypothetical protein
MKHFSIVRQVSFMRLVSIGMAALLAVSSIADAQIASVHFTIDPTRDVKPISRFIYGVNQFHLFLDGMNGPWSNLGFTRLGGNRFTAYNWTNNASQAGHDFHFQNDDYLVTGDAYRGLADAPGGALIPVIEIARKHNAACLLTVPINGYVAADKTIDSDIRKTPNYLAVRFKKEQPRKGSPFTTTPDPNQPIIYEDEFVNWLKTRYPYGENDSIHPIWISLDNEPDFWQATHPEIHPKNATYAELIEKTIAYADAIKRVEPRVLIFGPANYGWLGYIRLQEASDANNRDFQEVYLQAMATAEKIHHRRLLDVLDVHWYPEATGGGIRIDQDKPIPALIEARLQAPRSLWDSTYVEASWITKDSLGGKAIRLIPRLMDKIARNYPGTRLAVTEYYYGGGADISGAISQADALGIFGREGVFAAAIWTIDNVPFTAAAFTMFRNFDGRNGTFGDLSVHAETDDIAATSVYASLDSKDANRLTIVAMNKSDHAIRAVLNFEHAMSLRRADVYQLTAEAPVSRRAGHLTLAHPDAAAYIMPPRSVSTLAFFPAGNR